MTGKTDGSKLHKRYSHDLYNVTIMTAASEPQNRYLSGIIYNP
jgi:hypothetical protein